MLHGEHAQELGVVLLEADRVGDDAGLGARRHGAAGLDVERAAAAVVGAAPRTADAPQELFDRRDEVRGALADRAAEHERARCSGGRPPLAGDAPPWAGELAPQVQDDLHVVDVARTDRVAIAAEGARPDRLDHLVGGEARLKRLVASARGQQVEAGLLVRRAPEDAQAAADAVAEVQISLIAHGPPAGRSTTSRLRMNAGSSACFIAR